MNYADTGTRSHTMPSAATSPEPTDEPDRSDLPPMTPCSVVWCQGKPYVLESMARRPRWMGTDGHGRPQALTGEDLRRRGWSYRRH